MKPVFGEKFSAYKTSQLVFPQDFPPKKKKKGGYFCLNFNYRLFVRKISLQCRKFEGGGKNRACETLSHSQSVFHFSPHKQANTCKKAMDTHNDLYISQTQRSLVTNRCEQNISATDKRVKDTLADNKNKKYYQDFLLSPQACRYTLTGPFVGYTLLVFGRTPKLTSLLAP